IEGDFRQTVRIFKCIISVKTLYRLIPEPTRGRGVFWIVGIHVGFIARLAGLYVLQLTEPYRDDYLMLGNKHPILGSVIPCIHIIHTYILGLVVLPPIDVG